MVAAEVEDGELVIPLQMVGEGKDPVDVLVRIVSGTPAMIVCSAPGFSESISGSDLFDCLLELRVALESHGYLICCQGARRDVGTSGLTRQMSNGRLAYVLDPDRALSDEDLVDIFAPAPCDQVTTVEDQKQRVMEFLRARWRKGTS